MEQIKVDLILKNELPSIEAEFVSTEHNIRFSTSAPRLDLVSSIGEFYIGPKGDKGDKGDTGGVANVTKISLHGMHFNAIIDESKSHIIKFYKDCCGDEVSVSYKLQQGHVVVDSNVDLLGLTMLIMEM